MEAGEFFAVSWPELVPRLQSMLARAGAPTAERDDLVQETALRLFRMWDAVDPERPIEPLARRIAMNAWRDQWRRRGGREVLGDVPELATGSDTERAALARVELGEVSRALASLPVATAQVLRIAAGEAERGEARVATTSAQRMARSRARRALLACLKVASAAVVATLTGIRSLSRPATTATAVGAFAAIACVLALSLPGEAAAPSKGGQTLVVPAAAAATTMPARTALAAVRVEAAGVVPRHHGARPAAHEPSYYVVDTGPASVGVFVDVNVMGHGARVTEPDPRSQHPVCAYGATPTSPATPACSQP